MEPIKKELPILTQIIISIGVVILISGIIMWSTYIPNYKQSGFYTCLYSYEWDDNRRMREAPSDFAPFGSSNSWKGLSCGYRSGPVNPPILNVIGIIMIIIGVVMLYMKPRQD